jgi:diguanylate cyclase (GGDEF)-like protein
VPTRPVRAQATVVALYVFPSLLACVLWFAYRPADHSFGSPLALVLLTVAAIAAERAHLHVEVRKQAHVVAASDIPIAIGVVVLPPFGLLLISLIAKFVLSLAERRSVGKSAFNLGVDAFSSGVAIALARAISISGGISDPLTWLAVIVGVVTADVAAALLVVLAIGVAEKLVSRRRLASLVVPSIVIGVVGSVLALVGMLIVWVSAWAGSLLVVLFVVVVYGHRAYGRFLAQHARLGQVYEFSQLVESSRPDPTALGGLLEFIRETLNASRITLLLEIQESQEPVAISVLSIDADGEVDTSDTDSFADQLRQDVLVDGNSRLISNRRGKIDAFGQNLLAVRSANELMVAPLRTGERIAGLVEVCDRQGKLNAFTVEELRLLDNLASHLAVAVENQHLVQQLRMQAFQDQLTGLPNRIQFTADVAEALGNADPDTALGVAVFGVDAVSAVSETLGHEAGDQLLVAVANRLRRLPDPAVSVARVGGSVFALLLRAPDVPSVQALVRTWHERLHPPCQVGDVTIELALSGGLAIWPVHASDAAVLLQRANVALQSARTTGQPVVTFAAAMEHGSLRRLQLVTDLRVALAAGQLFLHYQPKVSLRDGDVAGVEALLRWEHPAYGNVPPDDFIPLAERTGLMGPLTRFVLDTALAQCRSWLDREVRIGVAVNLSVRSLLDPDLIAQVSDALRQSGVPPELLTLEITEGTVMAEPSRAIHMLHQLRELGVQLAVDDFGTGYSSLAYLRRLPIDSVKIDKGFVLGMGTDAGDLAIVRAVVELCHSLRFQVVAEGVEDELTRDLLRGLGCDAVQGYLISRPLPSERLDPWLASWLSSHSPDGRVRRLHVSGG